MKIYWTLKSVPELAPLTEKQRRRVHMQCLRRHFWFAPTTGRSIVAYLSLILITVIILVVGGSILRAFGGAYIFWLDAVLAGIGFMAGSFVFSRIAIPVLRPFYHEFIERDEKPMV
jgi:hypothetical protein